MITNDKVYRCACKVRGMQHVFTTDTSGKYALMVDPENAALLKNTGWHVAHVHRDSKRLHARSTSHAPGIKKGRQLHRLAVKVKKGDRRRVRALSNSLLDCRRANLQSVTRSDIAILNRTAAPTKAVGVHYSIPPRWLKTNCHYHISISIGGEKVHLGSFQSPEEGMTAWDAAAIKVHGADTTTNQTLGLLSPKVAKTRVCRKAARRARNKVKEHQLKAMLAKMEALEAASTTEEKAAIFRSMVSPGVRVASYAVHLPTT